jgi:phage shock protein A
VQPRWKRQNVIDNVRRQIKKLQQAITREEKTRETVEKKVRKIAERTAAREKLTSEKAARQAEKEVKRAQKAREAELRKIKIKRRRIERMQAKNRALKRPKWVRSGPLIMMRSMGRENGCASYGRICAINH